MKKRFMSLAIMIQQRDKNSPIYNVPVIIYNVQVSKPLR